jgi:hypothetical protein
LRDSFKVNVGDRPNSEPSTHRDSLTGRIGFSLPNSAFQSSRYFNLWQLDILPEEAQPRPEQSN